MIYLKKVFLLFFIVFCSIQAGAQNSDLQNWSYVKAKFIINPKFTVDVFPFIRSHMDVTETQNYSFDIYLKHKLSKHISAGMLSRTIWVPNSDMRQFNFYDIWVSSPLPGKSLSLDYRLRYHHGVEIQDRHDPDFFRTLFKVKGKLNKTFSPAIGTEFFHHINGPNKRARIRYELSMNITLANNLSLALTYWKEDIFQKDTKNINNIFVTGLVYKFVKKKQE